MVDPPHAHELPSNDGWTRVFFEFGPEAVGSVGELRAGSLILTRHYWDRVKLLDGHYDHGQPDFRLEFLQVLFRFDDLLAFASTLLEWSDLPFSKLADTPLRTEVLLCAGNRQELSMSFGKVPGYSRGDRAECRMCYRTCALDDTEEGACTFVVDISGARRFGGELLAALGRSA